MKRAQSRKRPFRVTAVHESGVTCSIKKINTSLSRRPGGRVSTVQGWAARVTETETGKQHDTHAQSQRDEARASKHQREKLVRRIHTSLPSHLFLEIQLERRVLELDSVLD